MDKHLCQIPEGNVDFRCEVCGYERFGTVSITTTSNLADALVGALTAFLARGEWRNSVNELEREKLWDLADELLRNIWSLREKATAIRPENGYDESKEGN